LEELSAKGSDFADVFRVAPIEERLRRPVENPADIHFVMTMYLAFLWLNHEDEKIWPGN